MRNVIITSERRCFILPQAARRAILAIEKLRLSSGMCPSSDDVYNLSKKYGLSISDDLYVELAYQNIKIINLDRKIGDAAVQKGIKIVIYFKYFLIFSTSTITNDFSFSISHVCCIYNLETKRHSEQ